VVGIDPNAKGTGCSRTNHNRWSSGRPEPEAPADPAVTIRRRSWDSRSFEDARGFVMRNRISGYEELAMRLKARLTSAMTLQRPSG
jgi:hypothetical protein